MGKHKDLCCFYGTCTQNWTLQAVSSGLTILQSEKSSKPGVVMYTCVTGALCFFSSKIACVDLSKCQPFTETKLSKKCMLLCQNWGQNSVLAWNIWLYLYIWHNDCFESEGQFASKPCQQSCKDACNLHIQQSLERKEECECCSIMTRNSATRGSGLSCEYVGFIALTCNEILYACQCFTRVQVLDFHVHVESFKVVGKEDIHYCWFKVVVYVLLWLVERVPSFMSFMFALSVQ